MLRYNVRMNSSVDGLLRTKLAPPRLHTAYVPRTSLLARIDDGLARKLTLIATPAGFGKTTLLAEWLQQKDERRRMKDEYAATSLHPSSFILPP